MEYQECYIAFLDMLGFKNLIKEKECDYLLKVFEKIRYPFKVSSKETDPSGKVIEGSQKNAFKKETKK